MAAVLTFLFKKDKDATSFEADLGKMVQGNPDLMPANKGQTLAEAFSFMKVKLITRRKSYRFLKMLCINFKVVIITSYKVSY